VETAHIFVLLVSLGVPVRRGQTCSHHCWHFRLAHYDATVFEIGIAADSLVVRLQREFDSRCDGATSDALLLSFGRASDLLPDHHRDTIGANQGGGA